MSEKSIPLVITLAQLQKLNIVKKVFGSSSSALMTRQQLLSLAGEVYRSLKIMNEYQVPEYEFSEEFIQKVLKEEFSLVSLDIAIKTVSKYAISPKVSLKLDQLKRNASTLLKVDKTGNFSLIKIGKLNKDLEVLFGSKSARIVTDYEADWIEANRTIDAQVYDLNYWVRQSVEWQLEGNKLVPKSLAVAKLDKSAFLKPLNFSTLAKKSLKATYSKIIKLDANF